MARPRPIPLPVRVPDEVRGELHQIAATHGLTLAAYVRKVLGEAIEAELADPPRPIEAEELAGLG